MPFRPNPFMMNRLNHFFQTDFLVENFNHLHSKFAFISVQYRSGDAAFGQSTWLRHPISSAKCFAVKAIESCHSYNNNKPCLFMITSDSQNGSQLIQQYIHKNVMKNHSFISYPGEVAHLDMENNWSHLTVSQRKEYFLKTYLDWILLANSQEMIISRSGFGETAAWVHLPKSYRFIQDSTNCRFDDKWIRKLPETT